MGLFLDMVAKGSFCNRPALPNWQHQDSVAWPGAFVPEEQVALWAVRGAPAPLLCHSTGQAATTQTLCWAKLGLSPVWNLSTPAATHAAGISAQVQWNKIGADDFQMT